MLFLRKDEVLEIHRQMLAQFGGLPGIGDEGLLDSALLAAAHREHYEGANLATCAATYAFHLARNHPFMDGNKRVAAAVAEIFVRLNGAQLSASNDEVVELFMGIASGARDARSGGARIRPLGHHSVIGRSVLCYEPAEWGGS